MSLSRAARCRGHSGFEAMTDNTTLNTPAALPQTQSFAEERARQQQAALIVGLATCMMIILDTSIVIAGLPDLRDGPGFASTGLR